jgi:hypothetical protein
MRFGVWLVISILVLSISAFGQVIDPVGFCAPPATVPACTNATGYGGESINIGGTSIGMEKNGSGTSDSPWYLLIAVPEVTADTAAMPALTIAGFTQQGATVDLGLFKPTSSKDIYSLATPALVSNGSLNAGNLFGSNEQFAFGGTPTDFSVFEYIFEPAFSSWTPYLITVGGAGLVNGTFLAASGVQAKGGEAFSTPYTTTGLVGGPGGTGHQSSPVPEPVSIVLLGTVSLFVLRGAKKAVERGKKI